MSFFRPTTLIGKIPVEIGLVASILNAYKKATTTMFIRFREVTSARYGDGERACVGKCKERPGYYPRYGVGLVVKGRTFLEGCPLKPICPLLKPTVRLDVSIVETRREGGKVRQRHIASLGSIYRDDTRQRIWFWEECDARLARLTNRLGPEAKHLRSAGSGSHTTTN